MSCCELTSTNHEFPGLCNQFHSAALQQPAVRAVHPVHPFCNPSFLMPDNSLSSAIRLGLPMRLNLLFSPRLRVNHGPAR